MIRTLTRLLFVVALIVAVSLAVIAAIFLAWLVGGA